MGGRIRSISSFVNWYTVTWFSMILLSGEITNPRTFGVKAKCFAKQNTRSILKTLLKACLQNHKNVTACETRFQRLDSNASIPTPRDFLFFGDRDKHSWKTSDSYRDPRIPLGYLFFFRIMNDGWTTGTNLLPGSFSSASICGWEKDPGCSRPCDHFWDKLLYRGWVNE